MRKNQLSDNHENKTVLKKIRLISFKRALLCTLVALSLILSDVVLPVSTFATDKVQAFTSTVQNTSGFENASFGQLQNTSVFEDESAGYSDMSEGSSEDIDYILGRPLTDAERKEQEEIISAYTGNLVESEPVVYVHIDENGNEIEEKEFIEPSASGLLSSEFNPSQISNVPLNNDLFSSVIRVQSDNCDKAESLPAKFDLRDKGAVTSVKNQNPYGTCWAFASIASSESNILMQGIGSSDIDLSELHLIYYYFHKANDPLNNLEHTGVSTTDMLNNGGNKERARDTLISWIGYESESDYPYSEANSISSSKYSDNNGITDKAAYRMTGYAMAQNSDRDAVKKLVMTYGAAATSFYYDSGFYCYDTAAYCQKTHTNTNHAVTIVGWNDDYSISNFTKQPSSKGAWICKNSWGPASGDLGYIYISYEDTSISNSSSACFITTKADTYDNNYQYDETANSITSGKISNVYKIASDELLSAVSVFLRADSNATVSLYKLNETEHLHVTNPEDGELLWTKSLKYEYDEYKHITLDQPVKVSEGDLISIVVETDDLFYMDNKASGKQTFRFSNGKWSDFNNGNLCAKLYTVDEACDNPISSVSIEASKNINKGVTYTFTPNISYSAAGSSIDRLIWISSNPEIVSVSPLGTITAFKGGTATITCRSKYNSNAASSCNVTVKLNAPISELSCNETELTIPKDNTLDFTYSFAPENTDDDITVIIDNKNILNIVSSSNGKITFKALSKGSAKFTVRSTSGKSFTVNVTVTDPEKETIYSTISNAAKVMLSNKKYKLTIADDKKYRSLNFVSVEYSADSDNISLTPSNPRGVGGVLIEINKVDTTKASGQKVKLTATINYKDSKGRSKTKVVKKSLTIKNPVLSINLNSKNISSVSKTDTFQIIAELNRNSDFPASNTKLKYMIVKSDGSKADSADKKVASVSSKGIVKFKAPGVTYIMVAAADSYVKATKTYLVNDIIKVTCPWANSVAFTKQSVEVKAGDKIDLNPFITYNPSTVFNQEKMKVKWSLSDKKLGSVSKGIFKAKKNVSGTVTVTFEPVGAVPYKATIPKATIDIIVK